MWAQHLLVAHVSFARNLFPATGGDDLFPHVQPAFRFVSVQLLDRLRIDVVDQKAFYPRPLVGNDVEITEMRGEFLEIF